MAGGDYVQSLARGVDVIRAFTGGPEGASSTSSAGLSLAEVTERTALSRATARRFLVTLADLGYVVRRGGRFELTPKVLELGYACFASADLSRLIQPVVEDLSARLGESVSAAVLDGGYIVYIARAPVRRVVRLEISVGTRLPAYATSMGRAQLAQLPAGQVRERLELPLAALTPDTVTDVNELFAQLWLGRRRGWILVEHELEAGLRSVAVPVFSPGGEVVAALNVALGTADGAAGSCAELENTFVGPLQEAAERVQVLLGLQW
ncbi:IclR family transcriptional regulator C-terminal domain-containing protein [Nesterenkonia halophila]|uniref:IclR family transcriptional regulator domain-containing protein n=1 Tax=Nesterenkonia halophila TaxID=302044 RepID=UPI001292638B|nr:IclR family transcriptional regulator C-terminal domain-containing protein [Nesterenkonia halophila]